MQPGERQQAMLAAAQAIQQLADWTGVSRPYERARRAFLDATGKTED
jgi:hypothetical protein